MEYRVITPDDSKYPHKLIERLGEKCPDKVYYDGPLEFLEHFTMAVISADSISGLAMVETNQVLFTIREYEMNYIGSWHSVMETEIFRLGLFRKNTTVTLFSAKGLQAETFESFLKDRFYPPLHEFPERDEYFRRAKNGELLMLSVSEAGEKRQLRKNIMERNWISCVLADIVFIPYGPKGSKTYTMAKRIVDTNIPVFTIGSDECRDLHKLGIPTFNRKTVKTFLKDRGAKLAIPPNEMRESMEVYEKPTNQQLSFIKEPSQIEIKFNRNNKDTGS
jgi:predicted Rossmann fold nucleotide-binding protein DprA/Smf involved in DNA uptake